MPPWQILEWPAPGPISWLEPSLSSLLLVSDCRGQCFSFSSLCLTGEHILPVPMTTLNLVLLGIFFFAEWLTSPQAPAFNSPLKLPQQHDTLIAKTWSHFQWHLKWTTRSFFFSCWLCLSPWPAWHCSSCDLSLGWCCCSLPPTWTSLYTPLNVRSSKFSSLATFPSALTSPCEIAPIHIASLTIKSLMPPGSESLVPTLIPWQINKWEKRRKKNMYIKVYYIKDWDSFLPITLNIKIDALQES